MTKFGNLRARIAARAEEEDKLQTSLATQSTVEAEEWHKPEGGSEPTMKLSTLRERMAAKAAQRKQEQDLDDSFSVDALTAEPKQEDRTVTLAQYKDGPDLTMAVGEVADKSAELRKQAAKLYRQIQEAVQSLNEAAAIVDTGSTLERIRAKKKVLEFTKEVEALTQERDAIMAEHDTLVGRGQSNEPEHSADDDVHEADVPQSTPEQPTEPEQAPVQETRKLSLRERLARKRQNEAEQSASSSVHEPEVPSEPKLDTVQPQAVEPARIVPAPAPEPKPQRKLTLKERIALRKAEAEQANAQPTEHAKDQATKPGSAEQTLGVGEATTDCTKAVDRAAEQQNFDVEKQLRPRVAGVEDDSPGRPAVHDVHTPANRQAVKLNEKQQEAVDKGVAGESFCLIGAAGTGKTTSVRQLAKELKKSGALTTVDYKRQGGEGRNDRVVAPSIAFVAFTRRAANNLRDSILADEELAEFKYCCQTIHNLLEYYPEQYEYEDENGDVRQSMRFVPAKGAWEKLDVTHLVIEEGSMVDLILADNLMQALRDGVQIIYIGDINQLPPVFGASILSYALVKLPIVELTEVYRQALDSGIIRNAHNILAGKDLEICDDFVAYEEYARGQGLGIKKVGDDIPVGGQAIQAGPAKLAKMYSQLFEGLYKKGEYDPEQDIILSPFNKHELGTVNMNNHIAQFLGTKRDAVVYEVITGFEKWYLAKGDRVMVDKQDGTITDIKVNMSYMGSSPQPAGTDLSRFGVRRFGDGHVAEMDDLDYSGFSLDAAMEEDAGERKRAASHRVTVTLDTGTEVTLDSSGDFSPQRFSLGYCLTVHKAQGCEWRKVYLILHKSHHVSATRELFYTGVTRARERCILLAKDFTLKQAVKAQRIKGDSTYEKIEYFNSGALADVDLVQVEKPKL